LQAPDLSLLLEAANAAGEIAKQFFGQGPKTWDKDGGQGPVTEADLAIDLMLKESLLSARPDYGWLSEETEDDARRLSRDTVFIVDPIDGTRAFIAGEKTFSHALAIAHRGQVMHAVVHLPLLDKTYAASLGEGARLNGEIISPATTAELEGAQTLIAKPGLEAKHWPGGVPPIERKFRSSLAYRLCIVADGSFDAMVTLRDAWEWDIAAGTLIATEAGAAVTTRENQRPLYNNEHPKLPGIVVANPALHAKFLERLGH